MARGLTVSGPAPEVGCHWARGASCPGPFRSRPLTLFQVSDSDSLAHIPLRAPSPSSTRRLPLPLFSLFNPACSFPICRYHFHFSPVLLTISFSLTAHRACRSTAETSPFSRSQTPKFQRNSPHKGSFRIHLRFFIHYRTNVQETQEDFPATSKARCNATKAFVYVCAIMLSSYQGDGRESDSAGYLRLDDG